MTQAQPPAGAPAPPPAAPPRSGSRRIGPAGRRPWLLLGVGAAVLALLVAVGVVALVRGGGSTSATTPGTGLTPGPTPSTGTTTTAPVQPASSASLFGVSIPMGADPQRIVQNIRSEYGTIPVARVFSATPPPDSWNDDPTLAALGTTSRIVYSFKADPVAAANGDYDAQLTRFLSSRPAGLKVWVAFYHEPEDQVAQGTFTAEQFRDATAHLAPVIRSAGGIPTLILMQYTLQPGSNRHWQDYYSPAVDVIGWDAYNTGVKRADPIYKPVSAVMDGILDVQKQTGKPFGIAEFGSPCIPSDPDCTGRAQWISELGAAFRQDGALFATYFDQKGVRGGPDFTLGDDPSRKAYTALLAD